ncbi:hypothetical protein BC826DRAFT_121251 [Russula brevipes]|nr:hypothetical protein BC826DRAFT_121251 [Russula brevipes]
MQSTAIPAFFLEESHGYVEALSSAGTQLRVPGSSDANISKHTVNHLVDNDALPHIWTATGPVKGITPQLGYCGGGAGLEGCHRTEGRAGQQLTSDNKLYIPQCFARKFMGYGHGHSPTAISITRWANWLSSRSITESSERALLSQRPNNFDRAVRFTPSYNMRKIYTGSGPGVKTGTRPKRLIADCLKGLSYYMDKRN